MSYGFFVYVFSILRIFRYVLNRAPGVIKRLMNYISFRSSFRLCIEAGSCVKLCSSGSEEDSEKDVFLKASILETGEVLSMLNISRFRE